MIIYKNLDRGQWAEQKLNSVFELLVNKTVSDIGSGFGWFGTIVKKKGLEWQPFDYVTKIKESTIWDLNDSVPEDKKQPGFVIFLEVLEHLSNPELGIKNISEHIEKGGYMALSTPNPLSAKSKFEMFFKGQLYAFQPKHLIEHHVFVPLPHVVKFYLEKNGFEIIEEAVIGNDIIFPKIQFSLNFMKSLFRFLVLKFLVFLDPSSIGHTQAFFVKKR
ncbi:methyltransferase domain-containing protein [Flavobacterium oreochromis]|uniref:Class I SAM-dependent methyltransferase n=1 Tax=Flavobacterium columnare TaxID=996 RepID=A0A246GFP9_9FLAO|nr:methyltransferase domain-containing protein [Flavobacterium oreochromis]OWP79616.1 hypothetical protein BWK62_01450 [Flavobacterium oreochromis]POR16811.1 hypothetical protein BWK58_15240 [Flavobacterium columnare]